MSRQKEEYFAYFLKQEDVSGVVRSWEECQRVVRGKSRSLHKKFSTHEQALRFLLAQCDQEKNSEPFSPALYFDSGTGRGDGVEVAVTNEKKEGQLFHLESSGIFDHPLTPWGTYLLLPKEDYTNNYGELFALYCALKLSSILGISRILGDSQLVLEYWSKGRGNRSKLPQKTVELIETTSHERILFEKKGGVLSSIGGDMNPADLGFHRP